MMHMWVSKAKAKELGCTHHALFMGVIPGFYGENDNLWVSRSDLLNPIEILLVFLWATFQEIRGEEPNFMFAVSRPI